ncbi:MAG: 4Fe-4S binding protein [Archaeoglobi archaeon]|nr:4Fe-4S binding protein [Archaeoglobi archaeon]
MELNGARNFLNNHLRRISQLFFFAITAYAWIRLYLFVSHFDYGTPYVERPTSIEAFLPIGALVSLKNLIQNGFIDPIHPAALVIFTSILLTAVLLKRGFCGWVCPIGLISEVVTKTGERLTGKVMLGSRYLAVIKYLLLAFFLYLILPMDAASTAAFLFSPYWAIADVKLLDFWLKPGTLTILVTGLIVIATLFVRNVWCRFLCPYGALLALLSYLSPASIKKSDCVGCLRCDEACPSGLKQSQVDEMKSPECIMCFECVKSCPYGYLTPAIAGKRVRKELYALAIAGIIFGFFVVAKLTGHWDTALTYADYRKLMPIRHLISH